MAELPELLALVYKLGALTTLTVATSVAYCSLKFISKPEPVNILRQHRSRISWRSASSPPALTFVCLQAYDGLRTFGPPSWCTE